MIKRFCVLIGLAALSGCGPEKTATFAFEIRSEGASVVATCEASSSGACHFNFSGKPLTLAAGQSQTVPGANVGDVYCADASALDLKKCEKSTIPAGVQRVSKTTTQRGS